MTRRNHTWIIIDITTDTTDVITRDCCMFVIHGTRHRGVLVVSKEEDEGCKGKRKMLILKIVLKTQGNGRREMMNEKRTTQVTFPPSTKGLFWICPAFLSSSSFLHHDWGWNRFLVIHGRKGKILRDECKTRSILLTLSSFVPQSNTRVVISKHEEQVCEKRSLCWEMIEKRQLPQWAMSINILVFLHTQWSGSSPAVYHTRKCVLDVLQLLSSSHSNTIKTQRRTTIENGCGMTECFQ